MTFDSPSSDAPLAIVVVLRQLFWSSNFDPTTATLQMNCGIANAIKRPTFPDRRFWIRWARFQRRRTPWTAGRRAGRRGLGLSVAPCARTPLFAYLIQTPAPQFGGRLPAGRT